MLDITAPIEPGRGLGGIAVGTAVADILATAEPVRIVEIPGDGEQPGVTIHSFGAIRTWSVEGRVEQVGAFEGYEGRMAQGLGIGSTLADVASACGPPVPLEAEGMVELPEVPGVGLETTEWSTGAEPDPRARVIQVFVHALED